MMYLFSGGNYPHQFKSLHSGNKIVGESWALDNGCFGGTFDEECFSKILADNEPAKERCLFIAMPDKVGDCIETLRLWDLYADKYKGWPLAFVAQDGQENKAFPDRPDWICLFIGGSTAWKEGQGAIECIKRAQAIGKRIHIGRVNSWRRYEHFSNLEGSEGFTCDGTKQRFAGREGALALYQSHMDRDRQFRFALPDGYRSGKSDSGETRPSGVNTYCACADRV